MASPINKETLEHLAKLARIELDTREEEKFLKDLGEILGYFEDLKSVGEETASAVPESQLKNAFREDDEPQGTLRGAGTDAFPDKKDGFLKVPPVFSAEGGSASGGE